VSRRLALVVAERAISPSLAPPLLLGVMLGQDVMQSLIFVDNSLRNPVFWGSLLCEVQ